MVSLTRLGRNAGMVHQSLKNSSQHPNIAATRSDRTLLVTKGIATSNKCLTSSNKKLLETISY